MNRDFRKRELDNRGRYLRDEVRQPSPASEEQHTHPHAAMMFRPLARQAVRDGPADQAAHPPSSSPMRDPVRASRPALPACLLMYMTPPEWT